MKVQLLSALVGATYASAAAIAERQVLSSLASAVTSAVASGTQAVSSATSSVAASASSAASSVTSSASSAASSATMSASSMSMSASAASSSLATAASSAVAATGTSSPSSTSSYPMPPTTVPTGVPPMGDYSGPLRPQVHFSPPVGCAFLSLLFAPSILSSRSPSSPTALHPLLVPHIISRPTRSPRAAQS